MDKEFNWLADVILGSEITSPAREVPDLPLDDPMFKARRTDSIPLTGAVDDLCAKLERETLISQLCPIEEGVKQAQLDRDVQRFSPPADLEAAGLHFVKHVMELGAERMQRKAEIS
ncbi:MAG: hypothetical protein WA182_12235, partial [Candidatus Sulfotelmatobacter sp.]